MYRSTTTQLDGIYARADVSGYRSGRDAVKMKSVTTACGVLSSTTINMLEERVDKGKMCLLVRCTEHFLRWYLYCKPVPSGAHANAMPCCFNWSSFNRRLLRCRAPYRGSTVDWCDSEGPFRVVSRC